MQSVSGTIRNGQVVLDEPLPLPDGTRVWVESIPAPGERLSPEESLRRQFGREGPKKYATVDEIIGSGEDLWESDEELDQFLADLRARKYR